MHRFTCLFGVTLILAGLAVPASADEGSWHLRAVGVWADPSLSGTVASDGADVRVAGSSDLGLGAALEYRIRDRFGVEIGAFSVSPGVELSSGAVFVQDSLSTLALTFDLDVHLTPDHPALDFYLGIGWADLSLGDLSYRVPVGERLDLQVADSSGWTAKAAVDYALGESGWGVTAGLRYIDADLEGSQLVDGFNATERFDNNLLVSTFGVAYGF